MEHKKFKGYGGINDLPDFILGYILGFLPILEAVRTCILSRQWRNLWKSTLTLKFDHTSIQNINIGENIDVAGSVNLFEYGVSIRVTHLLLKEDDIVGIPETDEVKDIKPLNDCVLIKVAEAEQKTAGGLFLTEASKDKPSFGTDAVPVNEAAGLRHEVDDLKKKAAAANTPFDVVKLPRWRRREAYLAIRL
ncbi:hypothetical protein IFM89_012156 [Coptis chinensis]|uniref:F-box domain-containing protein n=1 Tax=Coptis chinensis TaxID=261450 RepID=A0A835HVJ6_9MAGN|nr:hypothetical protein IFM89_012156 [Coptis chinensis]